MNTWLQLYPIPCTNTPRPRYTLKRYTNGTYTLGPWYGIPVIILSDFPAVSFSYLFCDTDSCQCKNQKLNVIEKGNLLNTPYTSHQHSWTQGYQRGPGQDQAGGFLAANCKAGQFHESRAGTILSWMLNRERLGQHMMVQVRVVFVIIYFR